MNPTKPRRPRRGTPRFDSLETRALMTHAPASSAFHEAQLQYRQLLIQQHQAAHNALTHRQGGTALGVAAADTSGTGGGSTPGSGTTGSNSTGGGNNLGPATNTYDVYDLNSNYIGGSLGLQSFVDGLYIDVLHRQATSDESSFWVGNLESGRFAPYTVVSYLLESPEAVAAGGDGQPLPQQHPTYNIYTAYLGGPIGVQAFVDGLYQDVVQRTPDPQGVAYWTNQIEGPKQLLPAKATFAFLSSAEYMQEFPTD